MLKKIGLLLLSLFLCSCAVSYPEETFNEDIQKLVQKESGYECKIYKIDTFLLNLCKMQFLQLQELL